MNRRIDFDAHVAAASAAVDLEVPETCREGVKRFLAVAAEMAETLEAVPLDEREQAPAPVYRPPETER
jgi:hypothetical protein